MEPSYSYNNLGTPICQLREVLSYILHCFPTDDEKKKVNANIQIICQSILQNSKNISYVDRFFLIRSMHEFANAGVEGYKKGKAAIRECYKSIIENMFVLDTFDSRYMTPNQLAPLDRKMLDTCMQTYQFDTAFLDYFFPLLQHNETIPQDVFFKLIQLGKIEEPILKQLYEMLKKSGSEACRYLDLIGKGLPELGLNPRLEEVGLYHTHLKWATEEDTIGSYDLDEYIENAKESDLNKILNILNEEIDGGYFLLKQAQFLSNNREELIQCILAVRHNFPKTSTHEIYTSPLKSYLNIDPADRLEVMEIAMIYYDKLKERFTGKERLKCQILKEMDVIPKEMWQNVCNVINCGKIFNEYNSMLRNMNRGFIVAYLLMPSISYENSTLNIVICDSLEKKLNDPSLSSKTRRGLACLVLDKWENLGIQENNVLYKLAVSTLSEKVQTMEIC